MKRSKLLFFRSLAISSVIMLCVCIGCYGTAKAYENTVCIGFGEYKTAVELIDGGIRILDFELRFFRSSDSRT